jgi:CheY-like chemotaxis protein
MKILYVEDHSSQRDIMKQMLELSGHEVIVAHNGEEGIEKTYEWFPDIILMDLRMQGIGGIEATRRIKSDATIAHIPVIILSAWTSRTNREKALEVGAAKFVTKPVQVDRFIQQINQFSPLEVEV